MEPAQCTAAGVAMVCIHFVAAVSMARKIGLIGFGNSFSPMILSRDMFVQG